MKTLITTITSLLISSIVFAQSIGQCDKIEFFYDDAGNRIMRKVVTTPGCNTPHLRIELEENQAVAKEEKSVQAELTSPESALEIQVYPNPAGPSINIVVNQSSNNATVLLYDTRGLLLQEETFSGYETTLNLHGLAQGMYIVSVRSGGEVQHTSFVKR